MAEIISAENSLVGSILLDPRCLPAVLEIVGADDIALEINRRIFRAAVELHQDGKTVDPVTIKRRSKLDEDQYMLELMETTGTAANAEVYAKEVRKASMRRQLNGLAQGILDDQWSDPRELIGQTQGALEAVEQRETLTELSGPDETMLAFYAHRDRVDTGGLGCVPTGLEPIDRILGGGMLNSGLYILAARPAMGKTALALQIIDHVAKYGPVLFVSLEMDLEQIEARRIGRLTGIPGDKLLMGKLNDKEYEKVAQASDKIRELPVSVNKKPAASVTDIGFMARKVKGLICIVVDYLGKITPETRKQGRYEYMTEISGDLKTLARRYKVPVLALAQLNRANTERSDKRPQLSDLRDTGAIEQDADGVIFLHREDYYQEKVDRDPWEPSELDIIVEKNRHGRTGTCKAAFYMATGRIVPAKVDRRSEVLE